VGHAESDQDSENWGYVMSCRDRFVRCTGTPIRNSSPMGCFLGSFILLHIRFHATGTAISLSLAECSFWNVDLGSALFFVCVEATKFQSTTSQIVNCCRRFDTFSGLRHGAVLIAERAVTCSCLPMFTGIFRNPLLSCRLNRETS
jgi:hypothetical protein